MQNFRPILAHTIPPFTTRISRVVGDVGVPGGECGNVQTDRGDRVITISLLGCSTFAALAMGGGEEEEEDEEEAEEEEEEKEKEKKNPPTHSLKSLLS